MLEKDKRMMTIICLKVLEQDDTDKDGRLSYSEFMAGRRRFLDDIILC